MEHNTSNFRTRFFTNLPVNIIIVMAFLLPIFFLPIATLDFLTTKASLVALLSCVALFVWAINRLKGDTATLPWNLPFAAMVIVPVAYVISAIASNSRQLSFFGRDMGFDSAVMMVLLFVLTIFVSLWFKDKKPATKLTIAIWISIFITITLHLARLLVMKFFPGFPALGFFADSATNTIGRWYDLGLLAGVGSVVSLAALELFKFIRPVRAALYVLLGVNLVTLAVVNFSLLWIIVGVVSLIFFVYFLSISKNHSASQQKEIPAASLITFLVSVVFILGGASISERMTDYLQISFLEARPSFAANIEILKQTLKADPVFGVGPAMFDTAWNAYKPATFNMGELWNVDFRYGHSFVMTFATMGGILGILAWLVFFGVYLYYGAISIFKPFTDQVSRYVLVSSFLTSLFLWIVAFFYVPSFVNLALTLLFTGLFFGSLYREGIITSKTFDTGNKPRAGFVYVFVLVITLLIALTGIWHFGSRTLAASYYQKAITATSLDTAQNYVVKALQAYPNDAYFTTLSQIGLQRLRDVVNNPDLAEAERVTSFRNVLGSTLQTVQQAIAFSPEQYTNYVQLGQVYESIVPLQVEQAYEAARDAYIKARQLNPNNPALVLALARLEVANKNNEAARTLIGEALQLKGNYTDAIFLLSQIDVSEGKIKQAITNVEQATLVRPNDPIVYFQLGILRYQNNDFAGAVSAFGRAVTLNPQYDNARYFLGLSLDKTKQKAEAVAQFELLSSRYPNDQQVAFILGNLRNNFPAFYGSKDPNLTNPEDSEELPLNEDEASE